LVDGLWIDGIDGEIRRSDQEWRVFEISSGDVGDAGNYGEQGRSNDMFTKGIVLILSIDSPHLRHVSAPLAREGISILYQSSYFTDFLLVKYEDFVRASDIFTMHGCELSCTLPFTPNTLYPSALLSSFHSGRELQDQLMYK